MSTKNNIQNFFPGSNTVKGFYSFYNYLKKGAKNTFIIKGGPGTGKSTTLFNIASHFTKKNYQVEYHWCSSDNDSLDGIVIPAKKTVIFDGTPPHQYGPQYPGAAEEIINFGSCWDKSLLLQNKTEIKELFDRINVLFKKAYNRLKISDLFFQERETVLTKKYNKEKTLNIINEINFQLLPKINITTGEHNSRNSTGDERHLFGSALTPAGHISIVNNITKNITNKYLLNGSPKTENSLILKKTGKLAQIRGFNVLYLHSGLNPELLDAVVIQESNTAFIRETNVFSPQQYTQKFTLLKEKEKCEQQQKYINQGISLIKKAKQEHDILENYYIKAMDFNKLNKIESQLIKEIEDY